MISIFQDVRYSVRMLRKNPLFFICVVLILAIGIGLNTAIFTLMNAVLLKPLPFWNPDQIVTLWETNHKKGITADTTSAANFIDWEDRNRSFSALAAASRIGSITLLGAGPAEEVEWCRVSSNYFALLGVKPHSGRAFLAESHQIVISYGFWKRKFGGTDSIGKIIHLDNQAYEITGILPELFQSPAGNADIWAPLIVDRIALEPTDRGQNYLRVFARLRSNITFEKANEDLEQIAKQLSTEFPESNRGTRILMIPLKDQILGTVKPMLFVAFASVASVLLIACANVASLVLTYFTRRAHEITIRAALGASRKTIAGQLMIETLLMSISGGLIGLIFAKFSLLFLLKWDPQIIPRLSESKITLESLFFTFSISILTGIIFGIIPALRGSEPAQNETWKIKTHGVSEGRKNVTLRNRFMIFEIAITLFLIMGAGLFMRSFFFLQNVDPGFDEDNLLVARIRLDDQYAQNGKQVQYFKDLMDRLNRIPGIVEAGAITVLPMNPFGIDFDVPYHQVDEAQPQQANAPRAKFRSATPDYFRTMRIPILDGRTFQDSDRLNAPRVVIINEDLAKRISPNSSSVGKKIRFFWADWQTYEIVGLVQDTRTYGPLVSAEPELFVPLAQIPYIVMNVVVRTASKPEKMFSAVRQAVLEIDPNQPLQSIETMTSLVKTSTLRERYVMFLISILSVIALALAIVGIYASVYFAVTNRKSEMGIRIALGATSTDILKTIVRPVIVFTAFGILWGLAGIVLFTRFLSSLLFGITPTDLSTLVIVSLLMIIVAAIAAFIPARKATQLDPAKVLRDL